MKDILSYRSFPWITQHDSMQCGIACLAMICRYYGINYSISQLENLCHATNQGVSMLAIKSTAKEIGFNVSSFMAEIGELKDCKLPMIMHWNQNHFVVLYKISKRYRKFYIADPGKGLLTYSLDEFKNHWISTTIDNKGNGALIMLEPTKYINEHRKVNNNKKCSFQILGEYFRQYHRYFALIIIGLLLGCILQLILPFLTQFIVDKGIKNKDIGLIWLILIGEMLIVIGKTAIDFIRRWLLLHISMRVNISLISDFFIKLLKLPMSFFDTKLTGDLMQRINDHNRIQTFLTTHILNAVFTFLSLIVFGIVLFIFSKSIFGVFLLGSFIYGIWVSFFLKKRKIIDYELFDRLAKNHNKTYQLITSIQEIKLQNCERRRRWEWEDIQADLYTIQMKSLKLQQTQEAGSIFINETKNILITVLAATAVINEDITLGTMLAVQYIVGQLNSPVEQLMTFIYSLQDMNISLERINEIHKSKNEESTANQLHHFALSDKCISIQKIDFKYNKYAFKKTLDAVSFEIPSGKVTAIVGASGSGKTTLIKLMLGYYPVMTGAIFIAGENINKYNLKWWRNQCGVVMQDGVIFSESIARNIAIDDGEINNEHLEQAARIANIHDYITNLPLKYNTQIGMDGQGLSQGQKQRILIARAVYKNPSYIFLDEATNALDTKNEKSIVENLNEFYKGRTVIIVAHRLSTVKNADQIIVLDKGKVVEIGNHASLIEKQGTYYNLVKNQLELGN